MENIGQVFPQFFFNSINFISIQWYISKEFSPLIVTIHATPNSKRGVGYVQFISN